VLLGSIVLSAPALWWGWIALTDDIDAAMLAMWGGLVGGVVVLVVGIAIGSVVFERRGGRLMEFVEST
jgi:ABC-2 type transport system permease protein